jgi:hypothetical protein
MTDSKKKKLYKIIERYKIMPKNEAVNIVGKLNDQELKLLISTYSDLDSYYSALDEEARITNPKEVEKINKEYDEKLIEINKKYRNESLKAQEVDDMEFEELEKKANQKINQQADNLHKEIEDLGKVRDEFYTAINKAIIKQQADSPVG